MRGFSWLSTLGTLGLGALLADDMGLGKTIQLIAHLLQRADSGNGDPRPHLVVCPTSVLGNWQREIERFAPGFRERIVGTAVRSTTQMSAYNANYVGGDIIGGASSPGQLLFRWARGATCR